MDLITRINDMLVEGDSDKLARWAQSFAKNHDGKTPDDKGWHDLCVEHMTGNIDDPDAYCARVRDSWKGSTYWRGKNKTEKEAKTAVKKHPNYPKGERTPKDGENKKEK